MVALRTVTILAFAFITCFGAAYGQVQLSCGSRMVHIAKFSVDSSESFDNSFVKDGIIPNIKVSANEIEIRVYIIGDNINYPTIYSLIKNKDSMICKKMRVIYTTTVVGRPGIPRYQEIMHKDNGYAFSRTFTKSIKDTFCADLDSLIFHRLFLIPDEKESLKRNRVKDSSAKALDAGVTMLFEIKVGTKFRNFKYSLGIASYINPADASDVNKIIYIFQNEKVEL